MIKFCFFGGGEDGRRIDRVGKGVEFFTVGISEVGKME